MNKSTNLPIQLMRRFLLYQSMKKLFYLPVLFVLLHQASCNQGIVTYDGEGLEIEEDSVRVYYIDFPKCDYSVMGHIQVNGGVYTLDGLFDDFRSQAAEVGADGVVVINAQRMDIKQYYGSAKAIRCLQNQEFSSSFSS